MYIAMPRLEIAVLVIDEFIFHLNNSIEDLQSNTAKTVVSPHQIHKHPVLFAGHQPAISPREEGRDELALGEVNRKNFPPQTKFFRVLRRLLGQFKKAEQELSLRI